MKRIKIKKVVFIALIVILAILPLITSNPFLLSLLFYTFLWALCGQAWNIIAGYCGQWSLGHALFFGLGAYGVVMAEHLFHINPLVGVLLGVICSIPFVFLIAALSFKLIGVYFCMATVVSPIIVEVLIGHYTHVKVGETVVGGWWGWIIKPLPLTDVHYYYILFLLVIAGLVFMKLLEKSRLGYFMKANRDDERLALSLGINTPKIKTIAMALSAMLTSIAGAIYALQTGFVAPMDVFEFHISMNMLLGPCIGGLGTVLGPFLGSLMVFPVFQFIHGWVGGRFIGMTYVLSGALLIIAYISRLKLYRPKPPTE